MVASAPNRKTPVSRLFEIAERRTSTREMVAVGGLGRVTGVFFAALLIGVLDFVLKIYFPKGGTIFIYALTLVLLLWRPQGLFGRKSS